jgi:hypothetical protein
MCGAIRLLPPTSSDRGALLSTGYVFMAWYLVAKHRNKFTFTYMFMSGVRVAQS